MTRRKSKFDGFILYDPKKNELVFMQWDISWGGVAEWFHTNGKKAWWVKKNSYIPEALKTYVLIDRLPEWEQL